MFLYQLRDLQLVALTPWRLMAVAAEKILRSPLFPFRQTETARKMAENLESFEQAARLSPPPAMLITRLSIHGRDVPVREETAETTPFCRLIHFKREARDPIIKEQIKRNPRVLIVGPYSGRSPILLRDTIKTMLTGHDVYFTLWADAKMVPLTAGSFNLEDQIALLARLIRKLGPDLHILAVSQGSVPALCAVALLAEAEKPVEPRSLTLIGGPLDASRAASPLSEVALTHPLDWFKETRIQLVPTYYPGAFRSVYPGFMRLQNRMPMMPDGRSEGERKDFNDLVRGCGENETALKELYDAFLAVMDVPAELYLHYIARTFQQGALANGAFMCHGRRVNPGAIRNTALLTVEAELDDQSPPGQTRAALDLCTGLDETMKRAHLEIGVGHYGIFIGRKWRNNVQPAIEAFIRSTCPRDEWELEGT